MSEEFKPITLNSQEEVDDFFKGRLQRQEQKHQKEIAAIKAEFADYEELKKKAGDTSELDGIRAQLEEATQKLAGYDAIIAEKDKKIKDFEVDALKAKVVAEYGLSHEAKAFLQGADEEALKSSAESLKALVGASHKAPLGSGEPGGSQDNGTKAAMMQFVQSLN